MACPCCTLTSFPCKAFGDASIRNGVRVRLFRGRMSKVIQFPERLRLLRGTRSQAEMASYLNVTQAAYSYWETGGHQPKLDVFVQICQRLNVSADWMLGMNDTPIWSELSIVENLAVVKAQADKAKESMDQVMAGIKSLDKKV